MLDILLIIMGKQKAQGEDYRESKYLAERIKTRQLLMSVLALSGDDRKVSNYQLARMLVNDYERKKDIIDELDTILREYSKQDLTVPYNKTQSTADLAQNLLRRLRREKEIMWTATCLQKEETQQLMSNNQTANEEIDYLKELLNEEQYEQQGWKQEALTMEQRNRGLKQELRTKTSRIVQLEKEVEQCVNTIGILKKQIVAHDKDNTALARKLLEKDDQSKKVATNLKRLKDAYEKKSQELIRIQQEMRERDQNPELLVSAKYKGSTPQEVTRMSLFGHLFVGDVIAEEEGMRSYLVETLQGLQNNAIAQTKLLYRMDPLNPVNPHRYIDGYPHLLLLIRTERGTVLGAYSEGAFRAKAISNHRGLILALTQRRAFHNVRKAIIYDENQIIFGNCELRIAHGDNKVHSNIGLNGGFYEGKGESVSVLLGNGKSREAKMVHYEIFQVQFEG